MQSGFATQQSITQQPAPPVNPAIASPTDPTLIFVGLLMALPIAIGLGVVSLKRYRTAIRRKRIEKLERSWNLNLERK